MTSIGANTFNGLVNIRDIDLAFNFISVFDRFALLGLTLIETVNLAGNPIVVISGSSIQQLCLTNPRCRIITSLSNFAN